MTMTFDGAATPSSASANETRLIYDGRTGELFVLWLKILLLGIITLGIYSRFWGKTRIRRYLWNHVSLLDERLEYDGTGGELFRRFLLALGFLVVVFVLTYGLNLVLQSMGLSAPVAGGLSRIPLLMLFAFLFFASQYGSRRYQFSRTVWHGIRGGVEGSSTGYALRAIGYSLLVPLTLGLAAPWQYVGLYRYKTRHSGFGDLDFHFEGTGRPLLKPFLLAYAATILGLIVAAVVGFAVIAATVGVMAVVGGGHNPDAAKGAVGAILLAVLLFYLTWLVISLVGYLHYYVRAFAYAADNTALGRVRFAFPMRKRELFWFQFGNFLLLAVTLGLGVPFVAQRYVRFFCNHLRIYGREELHALTQAPGRRLPKGGEGLAQLFDSLDVGGFI